MTPKFHTGQVVASPGALGPRAKFDNDRRLRLQW
jgi:hypothetical protein